MTVGIFDQLDEADTSSEAFAGGLRAHLREEGPVSLEPCAVRPRSFEGRAESVVVLTLDVASASDVTRLALPQVAEQYLRLAAGEMGSGHWSKVLPLVFVTRFVGQDIQTVSGEAADGTSAEFAVEPQEARPDLDGMARALFEGAAYEEFEDGMESRLSVQLERFVSERGKLAVEAVKPLIEQRLPNDAVVSEALTCLSRLRDSRTHSWRRHVLTVALCSPSVFVRDAAAVGLARLGDASAVDPLREALEREVSPLLKEYMAHVVKQLTEEQE